MDLFFISENICDFFPQETPLFLKTKGVIFLSSTVNLFQAHYFSYFSWNLIDFLAPKSPLFFKNKGTIFIYFFLSFFVQFLVVNFWDRL